MTALGEEGDLLIFVALAIDVHAVDHLAHVFFKADAVFFHRSDLAVEVVDEHPSLAHGEVDGFAADGFGLALVGAHLGVVAFEIGACFHLQDRASGAWGYRRPSCGSRWL